MIMRPGQAVLLPISTPFIWFSLSLSFVLNVAMSMALQGQTQGLPDFLVLTLCFWSLFAANRVGLSVAFLAGVLMDVHASSLLGQHALAYTVLAYLGLSLQRRLSFFTPGQQALQLMPVFFGIHALQWLVRALSDGGWSSWWLLLAPILETLLWPLWFLWLEWPQRRAPDPDQHRPL